MPRVSTIDATIDAKTNQPTERKVQRILGLHPERCTACRRCELACAATKSGSFHLSKSRISVLLPDNRTPSLVTCLHCNVPKCRDVCPTGAIVKDGATGIVSVENGKCVGCALCALACPYGGVTFLPNEAKTMRCDLCGGDPECVKACPTGAIEDINVVNVFDNLEHAEDLVSPGLSACLGCNAEMLVRFTLKVLGRNVIFAAGPSCLAGSGFVGYGAATGSKVPTYHSLLDNYAPMVAGAKRFYQMVGKEFYAVCFAGDGGTVDVGFQSLSAAAERGEDIIYICYDNEGYMNTGTQRSGTTPRSAWTTTTPVGPVRHGKMQHKKDMAMIMAMHDVPYVATAIATDFPDYYRKLRRAMEIKGGLRYIHLFSACPTGWKFPPTKTIEVCRLAVETNYFPIWEADHGKFKINKPVPFPRPIEEYLRLMGKFSHITREEIEELQAEVDRRYARLVHMTKLEY